VTDVQYIVLPEDILATTQSAWSSESGAA
jgi:hypothetical protein